MQILDWVKKQTGKIADNVKDYKFFVKHQPNHLDSSTTLNLTSYANRDEQATIPCIYKWSRLKNGLCTEIPEFKGNSFICEPSLIGSIIQAQVTSTDSQHPGTAILKFGPVKLDVLIKKEIEHSLAAKTAVFNVDLVQKSETKQCQIKINDQTIRIGHSHSNLQYTFDYSLNQPRIEASLKQPCKVLINFNEKYETDVRKFINQLYGSQDLTASLRSSNQHRLQLLFSNRAGKDKFLYVIKAYNTRKALKNAAVIQKIQNIDFNQDDNFNMMMEIQSLKVDLVKLNRLNQKYLADKRRYYEQARRSEKQIQQIIVTYTKIAQGKCSNQNQLDQSVMELREKKDEVMQRKLHALINQNQNLKERIYFITSQLESKNPQMIKANNSEQSRGGFIKKRQYEEAPSPFNNILDNLNESDVRQSSPLHDQVKQLNQEKTLLAKKLNESIMKIAKLQNKVKQSQLNNTAMNLQNNNLSQFSVDQRINVSSVQLGEERNKMYTQLEDLKKSNCKLLKENQILRSDIPMISSKTQQYNVMVVDQNGNGLKNQFHKKGNNISQLNPEINSQSVGALKKRIKELENENQQLKDQIQMLGIQKQILLKQKSAIQTKYKKKLNDVLNENSMHRRNSDALNRSQNLSMEMDLYNEQQNDLLKEQNQMLAKENERLSKICEKYMGEAKQVSKLKDEILDMKARQQSEKRKTELSYSKSQEELLLDQL